MTLIERERFLNFWNYEKNGGLIKIIPEENNRERGSPMQDNEENWWLLKRLEENIQEFGPITTIIEIGVADGGGAKIWEQLLLTNNLQNPKDLLYIGIDYTPNVLWDYKNSPINFRTISGNTHEEKTRNQVKEILNGRKADFLFIDAQHHSVDVKQDFIDYGGFVKENKIIGFHDTRLCRSFWDEFTGNCIDAGSDSSRPSGYNIQEEMIFHKEEFKNTLGTGIFYNIPNQTVINFRKD